MKKAILGSGLALLTVAAMQTEIGAHAELSGGDPTQGLAQAIGAELIREKDPTDAASTPKPKPNSETQSAPPTPEIQPEEPPPKPAVSDTTV